MAKREDLRQAKRSCRKFLLRRASSGQDRGASDVETARDLARTGVHAVGIGRKVVGGKATRTDCVRLYVIRKLPESVLRRRDLLPERIDGIPVDVIESQPARLVAESCTGARRDEQRPIRGGITAAHESVVRGTLACFCRSTNPEDAPGDVFLLSNNHVLARLNRSAIGEGIRQPSTGDGGMPQHEVARLHRFEELHLDGRTPNRVDAAIARLLPDIQFEPAVCEIGTIAGTEPARKEMLVRKHGCGTGMTRGVVVDVEYDPLIELDAFDPDLRGKFGNQIRIEPTSEHARFAGPGDSGSLVFHATRRRVVGLLFAAPLDGTYGVANPIDEVLRDLRIELIGGASRPSQRTSTALP